MIGKLTEEDAMPAGRFFMRGIAPVTGATVELPAELAHQVRDVLRLGPSASITLLDGEGWEYPAEVIELDRKRVAVRVGQRVPGQAEPPIRVVLYQGMLKAAKFELVLQKCTELGVAAFVPLLSERAVAASEATGAAKRQRWERILAEAMEQCGGARLPDLSEPRPLTHLWAEKPSDVTALFPWEGEHETSLQSALRDAIQRQGGLERIAEVRLVIGPEGGFSAAEAALARRHGAIPVTLGRRILRAETAAIAAAALTLAVLESL
jgi:16S rRNA (uracil1498-N3)-methyltransferase